MFRKKERKKLTVVFVDPKIKAGMREVKCGKSNPVFLVWYEPKEGFGIGGKPQMMLQQVPEGYRVTYHFSGEREEKTLN